MGIARKIGLYPDSAAHVDIRVAVVPSVKRVSAPAADRMSTQCKEDDKDRGDLFMQPPWQKLCGYSRTAVLKGVPDRTGQHTPMPPRCFPRPDLRSLADSPHRDILSELACLIGC